MILWVTSGLTCLLTRDKEGSMEVGMSETFRRRFLDWDQNISILAVGWSSNTESKLMWEFLEKLGTMSQVSYGILNWYSRASWLGALLCNIIRAEYSLLAPARVNENNQHTELCWSSDNSVARIKILPWPAAVTSLCCLVCNFGKHI